MYGLFYVGYMLFGGITGILSGVRLIDAFRQREEFYQAYMNIATREGYRQGYEEAMLEALEEDRYSVNPNFHMR